MLIPHLFLFTLLPAALATSQTFLAGYSTTSHFRCPNLHCPPSTLPISALPALLARLSGQSAPINFDLPLSSSQTHPSPQLTLLIHSTEAATPTKLLSDLSASIDAPSATTFVSHTDALPVLSDTRSVSQLAELARMDGVAMFADRRPDLVQVVLAGADETASLLDAVRVISRRVKGELVVLWAAREEGAPQKGGNDDGKGPADPKQGGKNSTGGMRRPEISEAGFAGLIVGFVFLMIFVPGFLCLWRIQTPQTFEIVEGNDVKKKMQ